MADAEDRTLAASQKRLQAARDEGRAPQSRDATMLAALGAGTLALVTMTPMQARDLGATLAGFLARAHRADPHQAILEAARAMAWTAAPIVLAVAVATAAATLLQTGFLLHLQAAMPDLARLNPARGFKRVFGPGVLLETGKSVLKLMLVASLLWSGLAGLAPKLIVSLQWDATHLLDGTFRGMLRIVFGLLAGQAAIALIDIVLGRLKHARSLRMSHQDVRDEHKESDGNPRVKARIKQLRRQRARRRMMAAVPNATVVITNPTHYAVALAYDKGGSGAPRVVAKGADEVAARIRAVAAEHRVPLVANPPLARALFPLEIDAEIPAEHFKAVAEIIAYVWRLRDRAPVGRPPARAPVGSPRARAPAAAP